MSDTNAVSETALNRAFALLKRSPIKDPENSSEYGRAAYNLSEHCQGKEDVSEAAMRIFAERIESLEKQIKDLNNFSNAQYEELERVYKERDEAITRRMETIMQCELYEQERDEARRESLEQARLLGISGEWGCKLIAERNELQEKYDKLATENMLEVNKICNQRDAAIDALMKIEDIYIDGDDTYEDWKSMGQIARTFLEKTYALTHLGTGMYFIEVDWNGQRSVRRMLITK
jgi:hypothetical protein